MKYRRLRIPGATYFFTLVTRQRTPVFACVENVQLLMTSIEQVRARHPFEIGAYVVLPDHLHMLWDLPDGDDRYSMRLRLIKENFTRAYRKRTSNSDSVWQSRFWEHTIRDERDFIEHLDYIHRNPVHHGFVENPAAWPHSSYKQWLERGVYSEGWGSDEKPSLPAWALRHE